MKCLCGCGESTPNESLKFKFGHIKRYIENHPGVLCECGCGERIFPTDSNLSPRFVKGHSRRGAKLSQVTKDKIKGSVDEWFAHNEFTPEQREAMGAPSRGIPRHAYSPEMRTKVKESVNRYWADHSHTKESIEKISVANLGKRRTEETKRKISTSMEGDKNPAKREDVAARISKTKTGQVGTPWKILRRSWDGKRVQLQGDRELAFAISLNSFNVRWLTHGEVGPLSYQKGGVWHGYTADFYIIETEQFIDVKTVFDITDKRKIKAVREANKHITLIVLEPHQDDDYLKSLERKLTDIN